MSVSEEIKNTQWDSESSSRMHATRTYFCLKGFGHIPNYLIALRIPLLTLLSGNNKPKRKKKSEESERLEHMAKDCMCARTEQVALLT